ncbi:hypothetical protein GCM10010435_51800 [Winogradskya consettensis]|uniref:Histidine kinase/HSP90-like ATPase domain-containing protein n=1 Tax=Winogradskya consettensis TaxID=113560 RepID=A0A919SGD1_9ACTN|nr:ATP-binding protein [Actinoplanes consettensis]GIM71902.1 hypothetical protein Aco04nite_27630 [Actinoplanes consettensis]
MEEEPPYLFDLHDPGVTVTTDIDGAVVDICVSGPWQRSVAATVDRVIQKCLTECPAGIVVDLSGIDDHGAESVATWVAAAQMADATEPPTQIALCMSPGTPLEKRLLRVGSNRFLAIFETPAQARVAIAARRVLADVIRLRLPPSLQSISVARNLVGGACHEWNMPRLLMPGRAVMSELVANAVEHARTEMDISVSRRGLGLHIAVRDRNPKLPHIRRPAAVLPGRPLDERGRGLQVVHADSTAWGAMRTTGGKMVWATIRERHGNRRRW